MNLNISWTSPVIAPTCGYKLHYRRNEDLAYTTSDITSGTTKSVPIIAPACYEGYVQANCCSGDLSNSIPFGVNAYSPLSTNIYIDTYFRLHVTALYKNSYNVRISGTFTSRRLGVDTIRTYAYTFPANSLDADVAIIIGVVPSGTTIVSQSVTAIYPLFNNSGQLQQYDSVATPPYFEFYASGSTVAAYNGSPASLPSFILNQFEVTEVDTSGTTTAGNLSVSWIQGEVFSSGTTSPYNTVTFTVYDSSTAPIGTVTVPAGTLGYRTAVIELTKAVDPLNTISQFTLSAYWSNGTKIDDHIFYLP